MNFLDFFHNSADRETSNGSGDRFNHRRFKPWYDDRADYNTNAKSYYDYLGRWNSWAHAVEDAINKLLRRNVQVKDTNTVDMTQEGKWEDQDTTTLSAVVKVSSKTEHDDVAKADLPNAISAKDDGIYARDYSSIIDKILQSLASTGYIEVPRNIDTTGNDRLITPVDLGNLTDDTRIGITWHQGSTRQTSYYTVADLRTHNSHVFGGNFGDAYNGAYFFETYTRIFGNKLMITTTKVMNIDDNNNVKWWTSSSDMSQFYDTQNPDYAQQVNGQDQGIIVERVTVYDLVPIFDK